MSRSLGTPFAVLAAGLVMFMASERPAAAQLIISEFRLFGPGGNPVNPTLRDNNEYIVIYNNSGADHTVASISGGGYGLAASDGVTRCTIPNGTVIPNRGSYLCVNSTGYT